MNFDETNIYQMEQSSNDNETPLMMQIKNYTMLRLKFYIDKIN